MLLLVCLALCIIAMVIFTLLGDQDSFGKHCLHPIEDFFMNLNAKPSLQDGGSTATAPSIGNLKYCKVSALTIDPLCYLTLNPVERW